MTEWKWIAAAVLALFMPGSAEAATEANFNLNSAGDLVELCSATPDNGIGTAALNSAKAISKEPSRSRC